MGISSLSPFAVEHAAKVVPVAEPVTMAMLSVLLAEQTDETRQLIQEIRSKTIVPVIWTELNEEQSEEGNYSRTVKRLELQVVRRNNPEVGIKGEGCKYNDFMAAKPSSVFGSPMPVVVMDWIS